MDELEERVKKLEYQNKLLCEAVIDATLSIVPRSEIWDWLHEERLKIIEE